MKKSYPLREIAKFLEKYGWKVIIIGPMRILGLPRKFCYTLEIDFLGGKNREGKDP